MTEKEAKAKGFERIVVEYNDAIDYGLPKAKAFLGRWIVDRKKPSEWWDEGGFNGRIFSVAETVKGGVVVYLYDKDDDGRSWGHKLLVYKSLGEAADDKEVSHVIREAVKLRGVPVEELDI